MRRIIRLGFLGLLLIFSSQSHAQLTVQASSNPSTLVSGLVGPGVQVSNVTLNCPNGASGTFNGASTNIGIAQGVLLTSGDVAIAAQANLSGSEGIDNLAPGDPILDSLSGVQTFDACALEFDIVATCDTISISYVFASEEYDEFVCAGVNDAFAFIITGPGLNNVNIATVPGTNTPVSINTVNVGLVGTFGSPGPGCELGNSAHYTQNITNTTHEYDGQTVRLEARTWVAPCSTYHIKLVVADGGDGVYDSGVFLEESGIRCASNQITVNTSTVSGSNYLVEGCTDAVLYFERSGILSTSYTLHYTVGGTAGNGTDYVQIPDSVVFMPGQDSVGLTLSAMNDGTVEAIESIFIIIADSNCGGAYSDTAEIFIADPPSAAFTYTAACPGFPVQFDDNSFSFGPIGQWTWDFGDGGSSNVANPLHTYGSPGNYTVDLLIVTNEGCRDSISQVVNVYSPPVAQWAATQFCNQIPTQFEDNSAIITVGDSIAAWSWDFGDGNNATLDDPAYVYGNPGVYNVTLVVTNTTGCRDTLVQPITIHPKPQASFTWSDDCEGATTDFQGAGTILSGTLQSWTWQMGDGTPYSGQVVSHIYGDTGHYAVELILGSDQGCRDTFVDTVQIFPNPTPDFAVSFACIGDTSFFSDLSTIPLGQVTGWDWQFGDGSSSNVQHPFHIYTTAGDYVVTLTATSDHGCFTVLQRSIGRPPVPAPPTPLHDTVCAGNPAEVQAYVNPAEGEINWYYTYGGTDPFMTGNAFQTPPQFITTPYYLETISPEGCRSIREAVFVYVENPPGVLAWSATEEAELPNAIVEFITEDPGADMGTYHWDFGDGTSSTASDPVHQYAHEGSYFVVLTATGWNGCVSVYELPEIIVTQQVNIFIPTAFTPNGDGLNDAFFVGTRLITELDIAIFDRWGKLLYQSRDLNFQWEGKGAQGEELPEGVYTYRVIAKTFEGERVEKAGTVTIVR